MSNKVTIKIETDDGRVSATLSAMLLLSLRNLGVGVNMTSDDMPSVMRVGADPESIGFNLRDVLAGSLVHVTDIQTKPEVVEGEVVTQAVPAAVAPAAPQYSNPRDPEPKK